MKSEPVELDEDLLEYEQDVREAAEFDALMAEIAANDLDDELSGLLDDDDDEVTAPAFHRLRRTIAGRWGPAAWQRTAGLAAAVGLALGGCLHRLAHVKWGPPAGWSLGQLLMADCAILLGLAAFVVLARSQKRRELRQMGVADELAAAVLALPTEPFLPMEDDVELAVKSYADVRSALRGPLKDEPGIDHAGVMRDAAAVLTKVLVRAPVVDRVLERSVDHEEVEPGTWERVDKDWSALVQQLNGTAEALLSYALSHDAAEMGAMQEHLDRLRDLREAYVDLSER